MAGAVCGQGLHCWYKGAICEKSVCTWRRTERWAEGAPADSYRESSVTEFGVVVVEERVK